MSVPVHTSHAPQAIGAYSQGMVHGDMLYLSGQIPLDPATGQMVGGDFALQIRRVLDNLQAVCAAAGGSLQNAVKLQVYVMDLQDFAAVNQAMEAFFEPPYPPAGGDRWRVCRGGPWWRSMALSLWGKRARAWIGKPCCRPRCVCSSASIRP